MTVRFATEQDKEQWNKFVLASSTGSFLQTWEWGEMQKLLDVHYWRLIAENDTGWQWVSLLLKRDLPLGFSWLYASHGPVFAESADNIESIHAFHKAIIDRAQQEKVSFFRLDPLVSEESGMAKQMSELGYRKAEREVQPRHTQLLDLTPPEEELLATMHSKTRYNVRLAERKGVTVRFSTSLHDVDAFLQLSHEVSARSGFHFHPDNYYRALVAALAPSTMVELAVAEYKDQPIAVHMMVYAGDAATYTHGASSHAQRSLMAPILTYWETIKRAKQKGMKTYDFFGIAPSDAGEDHPWAGITRVKQGFGGKPVSYIGAYDFVVSENSYNLLNTARRLRSLLR